MKKILIEIDSEKCIGCGACVNACMQGVIEMQNGKAVVVRENQCDGIGRCLNKCPVDAIKLIEKEIKPMVTPLKCGCPGTMVQDFSTCQSQPSETKHTENQESQLRQWPIQLHLIPASAPYLQNADLLICADCVAFAYADLQKNLIAGHRILIACPKLDDTTPYDEKLTEIIKNCALKSITVAYMEVPCCHSLVHLVERVLAKTNVSLKLNKVEISIQGKKKS